MQMTTDNRFGHFADLLTDFFGDLCNLDIWFYSIYPYPVGKFKTNFNYSFLFCDV